MTTRTSIPPDITQIHSARLAPTIWEVSWRDGQGDFWSGQGASYEQAMHVASRKHAATKAGPTHWGPEPPA